MKKKITSAFYFPGELDMQHRLSEPTQMESSYDLSAVLIHKGTAVNSGHYIAHIKDENTGQWWEFDDEHVSNLGHHPFGEGSSSSTSKLVKTEPVVNRTCTEQMTDVANGDHTDVVQKESCEPAAGSGSHVEVFSSSDAYMLMYNLRCSRKGNGNSLEVCGANAMEIEGDVISLYDGVSLPSHLCEEVKNLNASYVDSYEQYKSKKEMELNHISERRQEVRSVLSEAPVRSLKEPFYWISADWLRQWADNITSL